MSDARQGEDKLRPYDILAVIFRYPTPDYYRAVLAANEHFPEILGGFVEHVSVSTDAELEDLYIRTFDIHAVCFLEVGYVLFGEDYKRGHLLVKLQEILEEFGVDLQGELPDHLPVLLELLPRLQAARPEEARALVGKIILPALEKMLQGFAEKGNPYADPLKAVRGILNRDYPDCTGGPAGGDSRAVGYRPYELPAYRNDETTGDAYDG